MHLGQDVCKAAAEQGARSKTTRQQQEGSLLCAPTFGLGEVIVNVNKLRGIISKCNDDGTYDVSYNDGRADFSVAASLLKQYVAPPGK
jgi:hypothetical protein